MLLILKSIMSILLKIIASNTIDKPIIAQFSKKISKDFFPCYNLAAG